MNPIPFANAQDPRVIKKAQAGQRKAQAELIRQLQDPWYRCCLAMLGDTHAAADAVQETAMRFIQHLPAFRGDSQLKTWALGIALNVCRELRRAQSNQPAALIDQHDTPHPAPSPDARAIAGEQRNQLNLLLDQLAPRQREALVLRYFEQLTVDQTAQLMDCAPGTVKATVAQALDRLRQLWSDPS